MKKTGLLDFLGLAPNNVGTSGADAELGPGLYVTDDKETYVHLSLSLERHSC